MSHMQADNAEAEAGKATRAEDRARWMDGILDEENQMTHTWFWKTRLPERKGQLCKVLAHGKMNSVLVQFEDGYKVITSRYAVRKIK